MCTRIQVSPLHTPTIRCTISCFTSCQPVFSSWHLFLITPGSCVPISRPATVAQDPSLNQPGGLILSPGLHSQWPGGCWPRFLKEAAPHSQPAPFALKNTPGLGVFYLCRSEFTTPSLFSTLYHRDCHRAATETN